MGARHVFLLAFLLFSCASGDEVDPWQDDEFLEFAEEGEEQVVEARATKDAKEQKKIDEKKSKKDTVKKGPEHKVKSDIVIVDRGDPSNDGFGYFFETYPKKPTNPPGIEDRIRAFDPDRRKEPKYGLNPYLPVVPTKGTGAFPRDYVGVERWNRRDAIPKKDLHDQTDDFLDRKEFKETPKGAIKDGTAGKLNPDEDEFKSDVSMAQPLVSRVMDADKRYERFDLGPQGSFAMNFLEDLRGVSYAFGVNFVYLRNQYLALNSWVGYRKLVMGKSGASKIVLTQQNLALGLSLGPVLYIRGPRYVRLLFGAEFDYNLKTNRDLAGSGNESFPNVHFIAATMEVAYIEGGWGVFGKYGIIPRTITEDNPSFTHIGELGVIFYLL